MQLEILAAEIVLRVIGAFYFFGSIIGARIITRYSFIDHAIEAINGKPTPWAERFRERLMLAGLAPIVAGGLALMFLSPFATLLFTLSAIWQALYLSWFAPRYLDPHDDSGKEGRAKTWRAFWGYLIATVIVLAAAFTGILRGPDGLLAFGLGALITLAFAGLAFWSMRNKLAKAGGPFAALSTNPDDPSEGWDNLSENEFKIREPEDINVIIRPSWNNGALFHADFDNPVSRGWQEEYLSQFARDLLDNLNCVFRNLADPYDPRRCALMNPVDVKTIEVEGKAAFDLLCKELGAERVTFQPLAAPIDPVMIAERVKIEPFHMDAVIWSLDEPIHEHARKIPDGEFGISWSLARHLNDWAEDWHLAHPDEDEGADGAHDEWQQGEQDAHEERGRVLGVRLKRELIATGRAHVMVYYMTRGAGLLEAYADMEIPPLPAPRPNH